LEKKMKKGKKIKFNSIDVGKLGLNPVSIPIVTLGEGALKVVIICGMHGDEKSSLFIAKQLIDSLENMSLKGEVNIVLAANSWAQSLNTRVFPADNTDLNRVFPGDIGGSLINRVAAALVDFCRGSSVVIDLHTFEGVCPVVGLFMNTGNKKIRRETLKMLKVFRPDAVWKLNFNLPDEVRLSGALGPVLASEGIPNFAVETMPHTTICQEDLDKVTEGLLNVLAFLGILSGVVRKAEESLVLFERNNVRADKTGLFFSNRRVMTSVKEGDRIGDLVSLPDFVSTPVIAPCSGELVINTPRELVSTGDQLFSIGIRTTCSS
jgi:predicted deacylase